MINTVYRLVAPRRFEVAFEDINLFGENAIVRPTYLSICNADMRYYLGTRDAKVLAEKLPMALIHEGVGEVFLDPTGTFKTGDKVVMVPNAPVEKDEFIAEDYLQNSVARLWTAFCRNLLKFRLKGLLSFRTILI
mgnify:CR=1 FL=1